MELYRKQPVLEHEPIENTGTKTKILIFQKPEPKTIWISISVPVLCLNVITSFTFRVIFKFFHWCSINPYLPYPVLTRLRVINFDLGSPV